MISKITEQKTILAPQNLHGAPHYYHMNRNAVHKKTCRTMVFLFLYYLLVVGGGALVCGICFQIVVRNLH
jgi:hypothetical protein